MKRTIVVLLIFLGFIQLKADEGMWMLPLIEQLNIKKMQGMGCTLTADDIYSEKQVSLKDAVIIFGGGCTGVVVSDKGLIFTNHHCGYGAIQQLSAVEHNYLKDGFTAKEFKDEIYAPDLTVKFLVSITDISDRVLSALSDTLSIAQRKEKQDSVLKHIKDEYKKDNHYEVWTKSFHSGNAFYVFVLEEFRDIRLAYTPPSSIGKFGGDTDNWMWPRHTGDFSVFRVYADSTGKPADYSLSNIPYTPKKFASISLQGIQKGDFAMIMGHPGRTSRYLTADAISNRMKAGNQARIDIRGAKQEVWKSFMTQDEAINIAYASKYARSSNYWKNSIGMNKALIRLGVPDRKMQEETNLAKWIAASPERIQLYGNAVPVMKRNYKAVFPKLHAVSYLRESLLNGVEMPEIASDALTMIESKMTADSLKNAIRELYKDYAEKVDLAAFGVMLKSYRKYTDKQYHPEIYNIIDKKYKGDYQAFASDIFNKSAFSNLEKLEKKLKSGKRNFKNDPAVVYRNQMEALRDKIEDKAYNAHLDSLQYAERLYEAALIAMNREKGVSLYPDANSTMRLTYGQVLPYDPADAVSYDYTTSTDGILQKEIPGDYEFDVPANLKKAILEKDFGRYADADGRLTVNFLSTNDITGGNSGSPIFNKNGELLGLAFDGNWESLSGDIVFEPELQRTINVDIRYILFIMEKTGNATRLIQELKIR